MRKIFFGGVLTGLVVGSLSALGGHGVVHAQHAGGRPASAARHSLLAGFDEPTGTYIRWDASTIAGVEFTVPRTAPQGQTIQQASTLVIHTKDGRTANYRGIGAYTLGIDINSHWLASEP